MKKSYWKKRAKALSDLLDRAEGKVEDASGEIYDLRRQVAELTRELEDKRQNWAPIKIKHPYVPRDSGCMYCDDPAQDPRHYPDGPA